MKTVFVATADDSYIPILPKGIRYSPSTIPVAYTVRPDPPKKRPSS